MKRTSIVTTLALCLGLLLVVGCGSDEGGAGGGKKNTGGKGPAAKSLPQPKAGEGGAVGGRVVFDGEVPKAKPIVFGGEIQCAKLHETPPMTEDLVVGEGGGIRWAVVYLEGVAGKYDPPAEPFVVDQIGCIFVPHVAAMMAGQKTVFRNSDPVLHNVRATPELSDAINVAQSTKGQEFEFKFRRGEMGVRLKCDVHFWMDGYVHVFDHPFFAVTDETGQFAIEGIPDGTYKLHVWHEKLGTKSHDVTVADGKLAEVDFHLEK